MQTSWNLILPPFFQIFLKFRICYYDDSGTFISEYRSTSRNYMKRKVGFVFDMVFSFPYGLIIFHQMKRDPTKLLPMLIYVRIAHLPRIISLILFMWKEEQSLTNKFVFHWFFSISLIYILEKCKRLNVNVFKILP